MGELDTEIMQLWNDATLLRRELFSKVLVGQPANVALVATVEALIIIASRIAGAVKPERTAKELVTKDIPALLEKAYSMGPEHWEDEIEKFKR